MTFNRSIADTNEPFWIWGPLLFTGFYFMQTIIDFANISMFQLFFTLVNYAIFIALYAKIIHIRGDKIIPWLIGMAVFISLSTYFTYGSQSLFGYVAFIASYTLTLKRALGVFTSLVIAICISGYYFANSHAYFLVPALMISFGLFVFGHFSQREAKFRIKEKSNKDQIKQLGAIAERERIARDLHDIIGHSLSSIALKAELAEKYLNAEQRDKAQKEISEVANLSREILSEVRKTVSGLKDKNLSAELNKLVKELINQNFTVTVDNQLSKLNSTLESTVILILTEAVTNIMRHCNGDKVTISLYTDSQTIVLKIADNGDTKHYQYGNGLQGINERCNAVNGTLQINNNVGFTLTIKLPLYTDLTR